MVRVSQSEKLQTFRTAKTRVRLQIAIDIISFQSNLYC